MVKLDQNDFSFENSALVKFGMFGVTNISEKLEPSNSERLEYPDGKAFNVKVKYLPKFPCLVRSNGRDKGKICRYLSAKIFQTFPAN